MSKSNKFYELRKQAETLMPDHQENLPEMSRHEIQSLFHELETHQVELELQNTELRERQKELEISRYEYSELFDFAPVGYVLINPEGTILKINLAGAELLGAERRYLINVNFLRFIHADFWHTYSSYQKEVLNTLSPMTCELKLKRKDGTSFYVILKSVVIPNLGGNQIQIAILDIDDRKRAEEALEKSERTSRVLLDATHDSAVLMDTEKNILAANRIFAENFDTSENQLPGKNIRSIVPPDIYASRNEKFQHVLRQKKSIRFKDEHAGIISDNRLCPILDLYGNVSQVAAFSRDITQEEAMKNAEEARRKFEFIANSSKDFMTLINRDYVYEAANRAYRKFFNKTRKEIVGRTVAEVWGEAVFEHHIRPNLDRCFAGEEIHFSGWIEFHKKGRGYYDVSYYPYVNEQGDVTHVAVFSLDHTERKRVEQSLQESETRFRNAFDYAAIGMALMSMEGRFLTVNQAVCKMFGYDEKELVGKTFQEVTYPDDIHKEIELYNDFLSELKNYGGMEKRYIHKKGHLIRASLSLSAVRDAHGNVSHFVTQIQDITSRKYAEEALRKSEQQLGSMLHAIGDHIVMIDKDFRIMWANETSRQIFGEDMVEKKCYEIYHKKKGACCISDCHAFKSFQDGKIHEWETTLEVFGEEKYFYCTANVALRDSKGNPVSVIKIARDITRQKIAEKKLVQAYEDLKNTQAQLIQSAKLASIGELAAGVAHELNQPLTVIRATSQLMLQSFLKKEDDPSPQTENEKRQIEMIEKHTGRMMTIINHLRIFSHQSNAKFEAVNVNHVIEESLLMLGEQLRSHGILIKTELEPRLPKVYGNAIQLEQVFLNLFTNARDAIGSKRAEKKPDGQHLFIEKSFLEIVTRMGKYKKKKIEVLIKDSGCGIMKDRMNDIFDPFFTTKEVGKGTGLGLSISYGIIKDHCGKIEVLETGENGTTFRITLPVISKR